MKPVSIKSQWNAVPFSNLVQMFTHTGVKWFVRERQLQFMHELPLNLFANKLLYNDANSECNFARSSQCLGLTCVQARVLVK